MHDVSSAAPCHCAQHVPGVPVFNPHCLICGGTGERSLMVHFPAGPKVPPLPPYAEIWEAVDAIYKGARRDVHN